MRAKGVEGQNYPVANALIIVRGWAHGMAAEPRQTVTYGTERQRALYSLAYAAGERARIRCYYDDHDHDSIEECEHYQDLLASLAEE